MACIPFFKGYPASVVSSATEWGRARMAEKKEAAVAKFVESWSKKEMAKIEKALKPKRRKRR